MLPLPPPQTLARRSMKIREDVRQYAAQQGISEEEALEKGMERRARSFRKRGQNFIFTSDK